MENMNCYATVCKEDGTIADGACCLPKRAETLRRRHMSDHRYIKVGKERKVEKQEEKMAIEISVEEDRIYILCTDKLLTLCSFEILYSPFGWTSGSFNEFLVLCDPVGKKTSNND